MRKIEKEFEQIAAFIRARRNGTIGFLNYTAVSTYWSVGAYISTRVKSKAWGMGSVLALCDFLKTRHPKIRGFGQRQIYNMVEFFDAFSSVEFAQIHSRLKLDDFIVGYLPQTGGAEVLQSPTAKREEADRLFLQLPTANPNDGFAGLPPLPHFLALTTFTNHIEIINRCRTMEEMVFYILHAARERLNLMELRRAIVTQTYGSVMSKEKRVSRALKEKYPDAEFMLKDRAFLDFIPLPAKHTEPKLRRGILDHMKEFILELGKDYLYMGDEYHVQVGGSDKRLDLLFFHRGLQCLVDVELKAVPFKPEFISKMDVYLEALDRDVRRPYENPSVGLLLCPSADKCEVEYALNRTMSPTMVAEYQRLLIPKEVMRKSLEEYCLFLKHDMAKG